MRLTLFTRACAVFASMSDSALARELQALLRDARLQRVRDQILARFEFVGCSGFEKKMVRDHASEYLHAVFRAVDDAAEFTARCDFHLVRQLPPVARFLEGYNVEAMLVCGAGLHALDAFVARPSPLRLGPDGGAPAAEPVPERDASEAPGGGAAIAEAVMTPSLFTLRSECGTTREPLLAGPREPVPDDALVAACLACASFVLTETRDHQHEQLTLLSCLRMVSKYPPTHYRIRRDGCGRQYYVSWAANIPAAVPDAQPVSLTVQEVAAVLQHYDAMANQCYKHDPGVKVRPRWGRGDTTEVFWEAVARVLHPSGRAHKVVLG